ncbi:MAG: cyclic nucleotide-binding domain-containing protein [Mariprofundaceae bacterium]
MSIDVAWLEDQILKRKLGEDEKAELAGLVESETFHKGDVIMKEGEEGGVLYLLRSGSADIYRNIHGEDQRLATVREGALFGEMTFLTGGTASASVVANEDCVVYKLTRGGYARLMREKPELVYALFTYILSWTTQVIRHMNEETAGLMAYITGRRV